MMIAQAFLFIVAVMILVSYSSEEEREEGPDDCYHNGNFYPIYSKWASTIPNDCREIKCHKDQKMTSKPCKPEKPFIHEPGFTCYPIGVTSNSYPYCCPRHACVKEFNPEE